VDCPLAPGLPQEHLAAVIQLKSTVLALTVTIFIS
jgi:hypothetical protein